MREHDHGASDAFTVRELSSRDVAQELHGVKGYEAHEKDGAVRISEL